MDLFRLENITHNYFDKYTALSGISFPVNEGERFAIIGSNGCGKTSLLNILGGLIQPDKGKVYFRGNELTEKNLLDKEFSRKFRSEVGIVFQNSDVQLFCPTVYDELLFGPIQLGLGKNEAESRVNEVMTMLNIDKIKNRPPYILSGGEKKRVAIGSVLTMNPGVLLLDEPTGELDPKSQGFIAELIYTLSEAGKTIIIATHDLGLLQDLNPRVAVLSEEHTMEKIGTSDDILNDEALLLKVNLIHEHYHIHGGERHKHTHYKIHKH